MPEPLSTRILASGEAAHRVEGPSLKGRSAALSAVATGARPRDLPAELRAWFTVEEWWWLALDRASRAQASADPETSDAGDVIEEMTRMVLGAIRESAISAGYGDSFDPDVDVDEAALNAVARALSQVGLGRPAFWEADRIERTRRLLWSLRGLFLLTVADRETVLELAADAIGIWATELGQGWPDKIGPMNVALAIRRRIEDDAREYRWVAAWIVTETRAQDGPTFSEWAANQLLTLDSEEPEAVAARLGAAKRAAPALAFRAELDAGAEVPGAAEIYGVMSRRGAIGRAQLLDGLVRRYLARGEVHDAVGVILEYGYRVQLAPETVELLARLCRRRDLAAQRTALQAVLEEATEGQDVDRYLSVIDAEREVREAMGQGAWRRVLARSEHAGPVRAALAAEARGHYEKAIGLISEEADTPSIIAHRARLHLASGMGEARFALEAAFQDGHFLRADALALAAAWLEADDLAAAERWLDIAEERYPTAASESLRWHLADVALARATRLRAQERFGEADGLLALAGGQHGHELGARVIAERALVRELWLGPGAGVELLAEIDDSLACDALTTAIDLVSAHPDAWHDLGAALVSRLGPVALRLVGVAALACDRPDDAIGAAEIGLSMVEPRSGVDLFILLSDAQSVMGDLGAAAHALGRGLAALGPDRRLVLAAGKLLAGLSEEDAERWQAGLMAAIGPEAISELVQAIRRLAQEPESPLQNGGRRRGFSGRLVDALVGGNLEGRPEVEHVLDMAVYEAVGPSEAIELIYSSLVGSIERASKATDNRRVVAGAPSPVAERRPDGPAWNVREIRKASDGFDEPR